MAARLPHLNGETSLVGEVFEMPAEVGPDVVAEVPLAV